MRGGSQVNAGALGLGEARKEDEGLLLSFTSTTHGGSKKVGWSLQS